MYCMSLQLVLASASRFAFPIKLSRVWIVSSLLLVSGVFRPCLVANLSKYHPCTSLDAHRPCTSLDTFISMLHSVHYNSRYHHIHRSYLGYQQSSRCYQYRCFARFCLRMYIGRLWSYIAVFTHTFFGT